MIALKFCLCSVMLAVSWGASCILQMGEFTTSASTFSRAFATGDATFNEALQATDCGQRQQLFRFAAADFLVASEALAVADRFLTQDHRQAPMQATPLNYAPCTCDLASINSILSVVKQRLGCASHYYQQVQKISRGALCSLEVTSLHQINVQNIMDIRTLAQMISACASANCDGCNCLVHSY